jgi:hypothetical protein
VPIISYATHASEDVNTIKQRVRVTSELVT